ncbi:MAG: hypothetical protein IPN76_34750 [Saprospiraceae bacterium]|nr:hypothetical protein [Saprospiraceae bacterium]
MKRKTAQSNNDTSPMVARDFPSLRNLESLPSDLPIAQWQQYAEAASRFAAEWAHEVDEKGEAHSFWDEFLQIFNIRRRQFARHEARAKRSDNRRGFIDLFWPGKLLVEHKAGHKNKADDFDEALRQAMDYITFLGDKVKHIFVFFDEALRQAMDYIGELEAKERPQRLIICNFKVFRLYDLEGGIHSATTHKTNGEINFACSNSKWCGPSAYAPGNWSFFINLFNAFFNIL